MKVLMINGSPRLNGNTSIALCEIEKIFVAEGIETEIIRIDSKAIRGCIDCGNCAKNCLQRCIEPEIPYQIQQEHYLHCGNCHAVCPVQAVENEIGMTRAER